MTTSVAIIGAGMAGLACARQLMQAGHRVTVFEKSRGPSGRVSTRQGEGWQCDHGAQYFTASHPLFAAQVADWLAAGVAAEWSGRIFETDGQQFHPKRSDKTRYVGVPKNTAPANMLAHGCDLQLMQTVSQLTHVQGQWQIHSKEHGDWPQRFDAVVLAIPSVQAHSLLADTHPVFAALAQQVVMRGCWSVMARYLAPIDVPFDGLFVNHGPLSWVAKDSTKPGRSGADTAFADVWLLHAQAAWSEAHIEDAPEAVIAQLIDAFIALGGRQPDAVTAHRWRYADAANYLQQAFAWDPAAKIGLCGDWLNGGKVEGAWLSGHMLATEMRT